ncbi:MAG: hypothetical protein WD037_06170 [Balneolales bacterium]
MYIKLGGTPAGTERLTPAGTGRLTPAGTGVSPVPNLSSGLWPYPRLPFS